MMAVGGAWLAFKDVSMMELYRQAVQLPHPFWGVLVVGSGLVMVTCRALRWQLVIRQMGGLVSWRVSLRALWLGQMTNVLLPAKLGEAVKLGMLKRGGVPIGLGATWVLMDRLLDGLSIAGLGAIGWWGMHRMGGAVANWVGMAVLSGACLFICIGMGVMILPQLQWVHRGLGRLPLKIQPLMTEWLGHIQLIRQRMNVALGLGGLALGTLNWMGEMGMLWGMAGLVGVSIPWWMLVVGVAFTAFGGLVLSAPAGVGTVHFLLMTVLVSGGIDSESAGAMAIWMHGSGLLLQLLFGGVAYLIRPYH